MIEIEGRVLAGLDEFMLRAGHLVVLCRIAGEVGGSWARIKREAIERFSVLVNVPQEDIPFVAHYLSIKELCPKKGDATPSKAECRYPNLEVYEDELGRLLVRSTSDSSIVRVFWQDRNLAASGVRSRVGGLTWSARSGSKTGLSHICDWAQFLELIDSSGHLTPMGRLLIGISSHSSKPFCDWNPYVFGPEIVFIGYQYLKMDLDLFARLVVLALSEFSPMSKSACRRLFVAALKSAVEEAEKSRGLSPSVSFQIYQQFRDLERAAAKSSTAIESTSTSWHRTASRVEMLTDLGLLEKITEEEKFQYVYRQTERLKRSAETLLNATDATNWLEENLTSIVLQPLDAATQLTELPSDRSLLADIEKVTRALSLPTTLFPLDCLALGLIYLSACRHRYFSLKDFREKLQHLAQQSPDIARLSRGREGTRAEFISINLRKLAEACNEPGRSGV